MPIKVKIDLIGQNKAIKVKIELIGKKKTINVRIGQLW